MGSESKSQSPHGDCARKLVVCADGTWNRGGPGRSTNVWRLHQAIDRSCPGQITVHDNGVGTGKSWWSKFLGGAFGFGLFTNVRDLYAFLIRHYRAGDKLYLFGFSRGAFTVRLLSGVIDKCGILDLEKLAKAGVQITPERAARLALRTFRLSHARAVRRQQRKKLGKLMERLTHEPAEIRTARVDEQLTACLKSRFGHAAEIEFIGVWDTVRAFGGPFDELIHGLNELLCLSFDDQRLSPCVQRAAQALALDEARQTFAPIPWDVDDRGRVTQRWFVGVHTDVGGGYEKQGLAATTLRWMMDEANRGADDDAKLCYEPGALESIRAEANPHGELHDSRAGTSAFYRYRPRLLENNGALRTDIAVDESVIERLRYGTAGYRPTNLGCAPGTPIEDSSLEHAPDLAHRSVALLRSWVHFGTVLALLVGAVALLISSRIRPDIYAGDGLYKQLVCAAAKAAASLSPFDALDQRIYGAAWLVQQHPGRTLLVLAALVGLIGLCTILKRIQTSRAAAHWERARRDAARLDQGGAA